MLWWVFKNLTFWCIISDYILTFLEVVLQGQTARTHIKLYSSSTVLLKLNFIYCKNNIRAVITNSSKETSPTNFLLWQISCFFLLTFLSIFREEFYMIVFMPVLGYYNSQECILIQASGSNWNHLAKREKSPTKIQQKGLESGKSVGLELEKLF